MSGVELLFSMVFLSVFEGLNCFGDKYLKLNFVKMFVIMFLISLLILRCLYRFLLLKNERVDFCFNGWVGVREFVVLED